MKRLSGPNAAVVECGGICTRHCATPADKGASRLRVGAGMRSASEGVVGLRCGTAGVGRLSTCEPDSGFLGDGFPSARRRDG